MPFPNAVELAIQLYKAKLSANILLSLSVAADIPLSLLHLAMFICLIGDYAIISGIGLITQSFSKQN
jgi:hypothetical protein